MRPSGVVALLEQWQSFPVSSASPKLGAPSFFTAPRGHLQRDPRPQRGAGLCGPGRSAFRHRHDGGGAAAPLRAHHPGARGREGARAGGLAPPLFSRGCVEMR